MAVGEIVVWPVWGKTLVTMLIGQNPFHLILLGSATPTIAPDVNVLYYVTAVALSVPQAGPEARV